MTERIYDPVQVENRWQRFWREHRTNEIDLAAAKNPYYVLMMFPYPSAEGLHVGNVYAFTGADIQGRYRRLRGHDVFEPIGFDAFGIHSENFAMKINRHPRELIPSNIRNFTRQLEMMGFMFDWRRTVDTTTPEYYKWTQWVFLQLYKAGLAYRDEKEVNFCPACGTVIADEQVNPDGTCERHGDTAVERRRMPCWFFRITEFADRLVDNHAWLDWSDTTKIAQLNWIGRSEGAEVDFRVAGSDQTIRVFTTRPDTLFGATFMVLSPEHPLVDTIAAPDKKAAIAAYRAGAAGALNCGSGVPPESSQPQPSQQAPATPPNHAEALDAELVADALGASLGVHEDVEKRIGAFLPHWTQGSAIYSVTFRLADSIPADALRLYVAEREDILKTAQASKRPLSQDEQRRLAVLYSTKIEAALDRGAGECLLKDDEVAGVVADALRHFDGERYRLLAWCVMPNHVHVIFEPSAGNDLAAILHSWKSFTAHRINRLLGREGSVWQAEYFDHIVRNETALLRAAAYVWSNPDKARLKDWKWRWTTGPAELGRDARATVNGAPAGKQKTGVDIGARAVNPVTGQEIPIFIADYVLMGYGTGAIMAVPSGDHRDFEFAQRFGLRVQSIISPDVRQVAREDYSGIEFIDGKVDSDAERERLRLAVEAGEAAWSGPGTLINSANSEISLNGLPKDEAIAAITRWLEAKGLGHAKRQYRLRDWGISRQRYWGPPIPIVYDEAGNAHPVPEDQLPVLLPDTDDFRPKGDGRGPLASIPEWVNVEIDGKRYRRETDVMDNFLDSAWYYLRYISSDDDARAYDPALIDKWLPVDIYIGGNEHAVLHLLYTRFVCMALEKAGALAMGQRPEMRDGAEPFRKFRAHGLLIKDGSKMSKSKGNIVNPDEFVAQYGGDTLRTYLMFLGPYTHGGDFRDKDIMGVRRFFNRVYDWYFGEQQIVEDAQLPKELRVKLHQSIRKCGADIEALSYNTAIATLMELSNALRAAEATSRFAREAFCTMLAPFAPHLAEELWHDALGHTTSVFEARWPEYNEALTVLDEIEVPIQVNGKVRDKVVVPREADAAALEAAARASTGVQRALEQGGEIRKVIVVPGRLVNVIVK